MLRKIFGSRHRSHRDHLSSAEEVSVIHLAAAHSQFRATREEVDSHKTCQRFLDLLNDTACILRLKPTSRSYRAVFSINYRSLFPDAERSYRVDVLEASADWRSSIWVNGEKFKFSEEALRRADVLQRALTELGAMLERWSQPDVPRSFAKATRKEVKFTLTQLDIAWASFEETYISELIAFEVQARSLLVQAIDHERNVEVLEKKYPQGTLTARPCHVEEQTRLVASIARLNSVANIQGKGRGDFDVGVLLDAYATLRSGEVNSDANSAAHLLATDVIESYAAMRYYLREVHKCLERADCHLANNPGLVARLVDFEESWEVGVRYVQNPTMLGSLCDLVAEIKIAERIAPALTQMIVDCDVELFLCLPRIIWLRFLTEPAKHSELMASLLPHRFSASDQSSMRVGAGNDTAAIEEDLREVEEDLQAAIAAGDFSQAKELDEEKKALKDILKEVQSAAISPRLCTAPAADGGVDPPLEATSVSSVALADPRFADVELQRFVDMFHKIRAHVTASLPADIDGIPADRTWELLIRRAVLAGENLEPLYTCFTAAQREVVSHSVEELMHELERWSIELQRHRPEDWNQFVAIVVQCLEGGKQDDRKANFRV